MELNSMGDESILHFHLIPRTWSTEWFPMTGFQVNMRKENEPLPEEKQKSSLWESSATAMLNKRYNSISNRKKEWKRTYSMWFGYIWLSLIVFLLKTIVKIPLAFWQ